MRPDRPPSAVERLRAAARRLQGSAAPEARDVIPRVMSATGQAALQAPRLVSALQEAAPRLKPATSATAAPEMRGIVALPAPANPAIISLAAQAKKRSQVQVAKLTREGYAQDWRGFSDWCEGQSLALEPPSSGVVVAYLEALAQEGLKSNSIERILRGILWHYRARGYTCDGAAFGAFLRGLRRQRAGKESTRKAEPISREILTAMVRATPATIVGQRDRALLLTGWTGALRRSELVALNLDDLRFVPEGVVLTIRKSKTDQQGEGVQLGVRLAKNPELCTTRALSAWIAAAHLSDDGALFRRFIRSPKTGTLKLGGRLTDHSVSLIVKDGARRAELPWRGLSGHSLRAGFATTAARAGVPMADWMRQTRHRSVSVAQGYVRGGTLWVANPTDGLL